MAANDQVAQVIEQPVVDIVFDQRRHKAVSKRGYDYFLSPIDKNRDDSASFALKMLTSRGFRCDTGSIFGAIASADTRDPDGPVLAGNVHLVAESILAQRYFKTAIAITQPPVVILLPDLTVFEKEI